MTNGQPQDWLNVKTLKLHGESLTLNIGEYPSEENESFLWQILQRPQDVQEKYDLSPRACQGILRRAKERGKVLPEKLRIVLERQAQ